MPLSTPPSLNVSLLKYGFETVRVGRAKNEENFVP